MIEQKKDIVLLSYLEAAINIVERVVSYATPESHKAEVLTEIISKATKARDKITKRGK